MGDVKPDALSEALSGVQAALAARFGESVTFGEPFRGQLSVVCATGDLLAVLGFLKTEPTLAFAQALDVTAVDHLERSPRFDVVYSLVSLTLGARLWVKVRVDAGQAVPSATGLYSGVNYGEREVYDMFGIPFAGHPNLIRLVLPDDFEGHPLRRDFPIGNIPVDFDLPYRKRFSHATD